MSDETQELSTKEDAVEVSQPSTPQKRRGLKSGSSKKTLVGSAVALLVVGALIAGALVLEGGSLTSLFARDAVVAKVDDAKIYRSELDERLKQVRGPEATGEPDAIEEQKALEDLVSMRLILNIADKNGVTVTDEEVAQEIANLVTTFGDQSKLDAQLAAVGLSQDQLKSNLRKELVIRKVVDANTATDEIVVSDEEVRAYYDENGIADMEEAPAYEQIVPFIRDQLIQEKTRAILNEYITKLKNEATVEVLL